MIFLLSFQEEQNILCHYMWKSAPRDPTNRLTVAKHQQGRLKAKGSYGDLALILDPKKLFSTVILNRKKPDVLQLNWW